MKYEPFNHHDAPDPDGPFTIAPLSCPLRVPEFTLTPMGIAEQRLREREADREEMMRGFDCEGPYQ